MPTEKCFTKGAQEMPVAVRLKLIGAGSYKEAGSQRLIARLGLGLHQFSIVRRDGMGKLRLWLPTPGWTGLNSSWSYYS